MTICVRCKHFIYTGVSKKKIWYDCYCGAIRREKSCDPVTGLSCYDNDGRLSEDPYSFCRDVNQDGKCKFYQEKLTKKVRGIFGRSRREEESMGVNVTVETRTVEEFAESLARLAKAAEIYAIQRTMQGPWHLGEELWDAAAARLKKILEEKK